MREYMIVHRADPAVWSSLTIDANDTHALVVRDNSISTVSYDTAQTILTYCEQSPDFLVEELIGGY